MKEEVDKFITGWLFGFVFGLVSGAAIYAVYV